MTGGNVSFQLRTSSSSIDNFLPPASSFHSRASSSAKRSQRSPPFRKLSSIQIQGGYGLHVGGIELKIKNIKIFNHVYLL